MKYQKLVKKYLKGEWGEHHSDVFDVEKKWKFISLKNTTPQQKNSNDCGVYTLMYAIYLTDMLVQGGLSLDFDQSKMNCFRKKILLDALQGRTE